MIKLQLIILLGALIFINSSLAACTDPTNNATQNTLFPPSANSHQPTEGNDLVPSQTASPEPIPTCPPEYATPQALPANMQPEDYIGLRYYGHLPGLEYRSGIRVPRGNRHGLGVREVWDGQNRMVWLDWWVCHDSNGRPFWEIRDVIVIPEISKNQFLAFAVCGRSGALMPGIVAIGELTEQESKILLTPGPDPLTITDIKNAWIINLETLKLDPIPTKGVFCRYSHVR
jgi:hypothetical protein